MKIQTSEFAEKWEQWEYTLDSLPADFDDWELDDQYDWLQRNATDARLLHSEYCELGKIDHYEILDEN